MRYRGFLPLMITVLFTIVTGCSDDDNKNQLLEPKEKSSQLVALTQAFVIKKGQVQSVNVSNSVLAENILNWKLSILDDKSELGKISSKNDHFFDYSAEKEGIGHINYTVTNGNLSSNSQIVLAVNSGSTVGNTPPVARNLSLETKDDSNVSADLRDFISDDDDDTLQVTTLISGSGRFMLADDGHQVIFDSSDYIGTDQAVYGVDDGRGGYALGYIIANSVDSTDANTAPEAEDQTIAMDAAERSNIHIDLSVLMSDANNDFLMVDSLYSTNNRARLVSDNRVVYTPGEFRGTEQFTYRVSDSHGANAIGTITVKVTDSSANPEEPILTAYPQTLTIDQGDSVIVDVNQSVSRQNMDQWKLTRVEDQTGLGNISNINSSSFHYQAQTPGVASINYQVSGSGLESTSTIIIVINGMPSPENTPPVAKNVTLTTVDNTNISVNLAEQVSDVDGESLMITQLISVSERFSLNGDIVTFTPNGFVGIDQASYIVEDGEGGIASAYVVVNSESAEPALPNSPPEAQNYSHILDVNTLATWTFNLVDLRLISDADGDSLIIENVYSADGRAVKVADTKISYTPGHFRGLDQFTYTVIDGNGATAIGSINVAVNDSKPENIIPVAKAISVTVSDSDFSKTISLSEHVFDEDGDSLEIVDLLAAIGEVYVNPDNALEVIYKPNGFIGRDKIIYVISDGQGGLTMATLMVTVVPKNPTPPVANIVSIETTSDVAKTVDLSVYISDIETPTERLLITQLSPATSPAAVTLNGQSITYTPNGYIGMDRLVYTVSDGDLIDTGDIVILSTLNTNHSLIANDVVVSTGASMAVEIDLSSQISTSDVNAEPLTLVSAVGASLGNVTIDDINKKLIYTPKVGDYGKDTFVYTVKNSHEPALFAQGSVTVDILPPPEPEITSLTVTGIPKIGGVLNSNVTCARCNASQYQYVWSIDGLIVSTASAYSYQSTNPDLNLRLDVIGRDIYGRITSEYSVYRVSVTKEIYSAFSSFAALKNDGSVVTWGSGFGANSSDVDLSSKVEKIYSNQTDYAALKSDGSVVTWGRDFTGGDSSSVSSELSEGVVQVYTADFAFAAMKSDGQVVTWGSVYDGGDSSDIDFTGNVLDIFSNFIGFAALKENGTVETWGRGYPDSISGPDYNTDIKDVYASGVSFVGMKYDGTLSYWGQGDGMGTFLKLDFSAGVKDIVSTSNSFLTLMGDNSVLAWGHNSRAGEMPIKMDTTRVRRIFANNNKFALLRWDKTVSSWQFYTEDTFPQSLADIETIIPANSSDGFSAIAEDGSVYVWGNDFKDGKVFGVSLKPDATIKATTKAFAAVDQNGQVVTWGDSSKGGQVPDSVNANGNGIRSLYSSLGSFMVIKNDWSVETWGSISDVPPKLAQPYIALVETSAGP
ncbi:Ig-like domain-containing protein [Vibrio sagamiensis]|uniref:Tandem-95 repeat protein n=3 Tax=Vibrio sagamiensis TaxID=512650 RepID=A0A511QID8_9VIBR|nr:Ig-like domain-containing protein [Vibrio sagamiensis]PNQ54667.1 hypothetical protein C1141_14915 [Vibrio agarivorans]GEM77078.1 hypothetical protein VSA01S_31900 [Vibrio sagamiensis NBRC 104589]